MHYLRVVPQIPRELKTFDPERRQKLIQLADLVLSSQNDQSALRTVRYLLGLVNINAVPDPVPPLPWLSTRCRSEFDDLIDLDVTNSVVGRIIPQMEFTARIQRR